MWRCLQLAKLGESYVSPNPMVGAVLEYNGKIIGEGYHHRYGEAHAEPNAINSVTDKDLISKSTLYVNLEPCSYFGKTPPCADLIVQSGIRKVVIGTIDPNPKVKGKGIEILQNAGIEVVKNVLEDECRKLNKRFFTYQESSRPFILLKWAQTQDGFIDVIRKDSTILPLMISNSLTRQLTHKMRSENQSILVGSNTVLLDNPSLTVRDWSGKSPIRIILNRQGNIPESYHVLDNNVQTLIFTSFPKLPKQKVEYLNFDFEKNDMKLLIDKIYEKNIQSVLVEGGAKLLKSFLSSGLWDEANVEVSNQLLGSGISAPEITIPPCNCNIIEGHKWLHYKNIH